MCLEISSRRSAEAEEGEILSRFFLKAIKTAHKGIPNRRLMKRRGRWLKQEKLVRARGILCLGRDNNIDDSFIALFLPFPHLTAGKKLQSNA